MFNQVLTKFQGFFSRSFWFGSFLPVAITAAFHLAVIEIVFPDLVPLSSWLKAGLGDKATELTLFIAALVVLAYVLTPFTPLFRGILDGRLLPDWLHDSLRASRYLSWREAKQKMSAAADDRGFFLRMYRVRVKEIWASQRAPTGNGGPNAHVIERAKAAINQAKTAIDTALNSARSTGLPDRSATEAAVSALIDAQGSCGPGTPEEKRKELAQAQSLLIELLSEAESEAEYRLSRMTPTFRRVDLVPTRVGEARRLVERYSKDTYGVEFDFVWPRIQMLLPNDDDGFTQRLQDAQAQLNFSVLTLALAVTVPLVWLPMLLIKSTSPTSAWMFLAVGLLSPLILLFLYELVVQSQSVFGEVVRAAIDKYRLQVLTEIAHQPLPATLSAERALWMGLRMASEPGNEFDLAIVHETS